MDQIFVGVGVIVEKDNKFLVVKESSGQYSFPGGHVMNNESIESASIREVLEETNAQIEVEYIIGFYLIPGALGIGIKAKYIKEDQFLPTDEIQSIHWMDKSEISNLKDQFRPGQLIGYSDYLKNKKLELSTITNFL